MQRHDVASTLRRRYIYVMCLPGNEYPQHMWFTENRENLSSNTPKELFSIQVLQKVCEVAKIITHLPYVQLWINIGAI